jgi:hypothetical protein
MVYTIAPFLPEAPFPHPLASNTATLFFGETRRMKYAAYNPVRPPPRAVARIVWTEFFLR